MPDFYDAGLLQQIATNLFYGWGYNFYKVENQLRADDQLIRSRCVALLNAAAATVVSVEAQYRRERLPPPTRAKPFPDAEAIAGAQALERLHRALTALAARVQSAPVPGNDRIFQRYRDEALNLAALLERDAQLVGRCDLLRSTIAEKDAGWLLGNMPQLEAGITATDAALVGREHFLTGLPG